MRCIKSKRLRYYLEEHNYYPDYEIFGYGYYTMNDAIGELIDKYYIQYVCVPNKAY